MKSIENNLKKMEELSEECRELQEKENKLLDELKKSIEKNDN